MDNTKKQILKITGERIRRARLVKGLTQGELATLCGYSDSTTIYKIEKGKQDIPTSKIKLLCKALDIDFNYLKGDIDYIINVGGSAVIFERRSVDERRDELMHKIADLLSKASEKQLNQILSIISVIVGGDEDGDADME